MQEIKMYVSAANALGVVRDFVNAKNATPPTLVRGCRTCLKIRLFANSYDATPYPVEQLNGITVWEWLMDDDFTEDTACKITADNAAITVEKVFDTDGEFTQEYTEVTVPIPDMNTEELATWLGNAKSKSGLNAELVGYNGDGEQVFVLQIENFTVRNRIASLGDPTAIDPEYLTETQIRAMIFSGLNLQFSADGTDWHNTQDTADSYYRISIDALEDGAWSNPILLVNTKGNQGEPGSQGIQGEPGTSAYIYVAYAADNTGTDFSTTPSNTRKYRAELHTATRIGTLTLSDFSDCEWVKYLGDNGISHYVYVAYASDNTGGNFSTTPSETRKYRAEIHVDSPIETLTASDFRNAYWIKYIGDDGTDGKDGIDGVDGEPGEGVTEILAELDALKSTVESNTSNITSLSENKADKGNHTADEAYEFAESGIRDLSGTVETNSSGIQSCQSDIQSLQQKDSEMEARIAPLEGMSGELYSLQTTVQELQSRVSALEQNSN